MSGIIGAAAGGVLLIIGGVLFFRRKSGTSNVESKRKQSAANVDEAYSVDVKKATTEVEVDKGSATEQKVVL